MWFLITFLDIFMLPPPSFWQPEPNPQPMALSLVFSPMQSVEGETTVSLLEPVNKGAGVTLHPTPYSAKVMIWLLSPEAGGPGLSEAAAAPCLWSVVLCWLHPKGLSSFRHGGSGDRKGFLWRPESRPGPWEHSHEWHIQHSRHSNWLKGINHLLFKRQVVRAVHFCFQ